MLHQFSILMAAHFEPNLNFSIEMVYAKFVLFAW